MLKENKLINKATWLMLVLISLSAIVLIKRFSPYIPDYDGLMYFDIAKTTNGWLFKSSDFNIWVAHTNDSVKFWPISNALSVFIAAIFFHIIDTNLLPSLINSLYLFLFVAYLTKVRSASYTFIATLLLCSHTLFFRLFTTFTTEFSVGLWIFSFLLTLMTAKERRGIYLAVLTILGLLLRTIDVVFILMAVSAYSVIYYALWDDRPRIFITLRYVGLSLFLTAPFFFQHYKVAFEYVYSASFGATAASWKSLGGVSDRYDVILQYGRLLFVYNPLVLPAAALIGGFSFFSKALSWRTVALVTGISLSVCFPLLMASSLNIQVVYWVYASLIFIICELGFLFFQADINIKKIPCTVIIVKNTCIAGVLFVCVFFLARSWNYELPYLAQQHHISKIAYDISAVLDSEPGKPTIAANYRGVGALDMLGLAWHKRENFLYGGIEDIYSKNKQPTDYLELKEATNFFITAHENYFFAPHFGINEHIRETHRLFIDKSAELGFRKVQEISRDGRKFDIWYRPSVQAYLQYANFEDNWISRNLPIKVGTEKLCSGEKISGKLNFSVNFPNPNLPSYTPPFLITVRSENARDILASAIVDNFGIANIVLDLKNIVCGEYELSIDKAFSTKADPRELSAQFIKIESTFKFDAN